LSGGRTRRCPQRARLRGEIRDRELNIETGLAFDEETAVKIAEAFLRRRQGLARALPESKAAEPSPTGPQQGAPTESLSGRSLRE